MSCANILLSRRVVCVTKKKSISSAGFTASITISTVSRQNIMNKLLCVHILHPANATKHFNRRRSQRSITAVYACHTAGNLFTADRVWRARVGTAGRSSSGTTCTVTAQETPPVQPAGTPPHTIYSRGWHGKLLLTHWNILSRGMKTYKVYINTAATTAACSFCCGNKSVWKTLFV